MTTDTTEKGLETPIMQHMTGTDGLAVTPNVVAERPPPYGGTGYTAGSARDYDRAHALDVPELFAFMRATQPEAFKTLAMADADDARDINRLKFLACRVVDVVTGKLGVRHAAAQVPDEGEVPEPLDSGDSLSDGEEQTADDPDGVHEEAEA